ncbi:glutathione S-transferase family protein (plasmid) [Brevundimonas staleyi]|uniref:Glutathione S-transferase family protein n=1 Tax=Brevundimonas staleyi TaxID=74326 RepID=A0ABW0FN22_9CAUL
MKLYIADKTSSEAVQVVINELGLPVELVHYDVKDRSTSTGENFAAVNPLFYVPVLALENATLDQLTEATVITAYLADQHPEAGLAPAPGTLERVKFDQLQTFIVTEIAQRHVPLMRKLMNEEGVAWMKAKIVAGYAILDERLASQPFIAGDGFSIADAFTWATMWSERSGVDISHLKNLLAWKARMDERPSVRKALADEAAVAAAHKAQLAA